MSIYFPKDNFDNLEPAVRTEAEARRNHLHNLCYIFNRTYKVLNSNISRIDTNSAVFKHQINTYINAIGAMIDVKEMEIDDSIRKNKVVFSFQYETSYYLSRLITKFATLR